MCVELNYDRSQSLIAQIVSILLLVNSVVIIILQFLFSTF